MIVTREFQSSLCIIIWKRLQTFTKERNNSLFHWITTLRFFHLIRDTDGLQKMWWEGISSIFESSNNPQQIKAFMRVSWSLTTEGEIIHKKLNTFKKEHLSYFSQTISDVHLRNNFRKWNVKFLHSVKIRKLKLRIFYWQRRLYSQYRKIYCSLTKG